MKIAVLGTWHLGTVTAASLSKLGFQVIGIDDDNEIIENLNKGVPPLFEPGLEDLIKSGIQQKTLSFSSDLSTISEADYLWVCYDTPVNDLDVADTEFVKNKIIAALKHFPQNRGVIVSSQLPVESISELEKLTNGKYHWAASPENLRLGNALDVFLNPDRIIVGTRKGQKDFFSPVFEKITNRIEWMGIESAEMTKHGINAFLAQSVSFANELAHLALEVGADPYEVARGLKTEKRIGKYAYLRPGPAFSGGTLARDLGYLKDKAKKYSLQAKLSEAAFEANNEHKTWLRNRIIKSLKGQPLKNKQIAVLGLTYKAGTDTLRRSSSIEICKWLLEQGANICAYDPRVKEVPKELNISLCPNIESCIDNSDLIFLGTEHPEFKDMNESAWSKLKTKPLIDPGEFLGKETKNYSFRNIEGTKQ